MNDMEKLQEEISKEGSQLDDIYKVLKHIRWILMAGVITLMCILSWISDKLGGYNSWSEWFGFL
jgi:hypothetical protein